MRVLVNLQVGHTNNRIILNLFAGATQNRADTGHNLLEAEWLGHVVVAANGKAHDLVLRVIACGQKQYGCVDALLTDATGYGEAVNVRQHYIQHDEVGLYLFDDFDGFRTGGRGVHLESGKMQRSDEQFADGRFVINNNNRCFNRLTHVLQIGLLHWTFPECPLGVRPQIPARLRKPARFRLRNPS